MQEIFQSFNEFEIYYITYITFFIKHLYQNPLQLIIKYKDKMRYYAKFHNELNLIKN